MWVRMLGRWDVSRSPPPTAVAEHEALVVDDADQAGADKHASLEHADEKLVEADGLHHGGHQHGQCNGVAVPRRLCVVLLGELGVLKRQCHSFPVPHIVNVQDKRTQQLRRRKGQQILRQLENGGRPKDATKGAV